MSSDEELPLPECLRGATPIHTSATCRFFLIGNFQDDEEPMVAKMAIRASTKEDLRRERSRYARIQAAAAAAAGTRHEHLLTCYGMLGDHGLLLSHAARGTLADYVAAHGAPHLWARLGWLEQIVQAVRCLHRRYVFHGHLHARHVLLDDRFRARLADLSQSTLRGEFLRGAGDVPAAYRLPHNDLGTERVDVFAFGSLAYELLTGRAPYAALADDEIRQRFERHRFPDAEADLAAVGARVLGRVVAKCWQGAYATTWAFVDDWQKEKENVSK